MSEQKAAISELEALRRAFDEGFAAPAAGRACAGAETFLALRAAGESVAVRLNQVRGLLAGRRITPVPSRLEELLGLAGIRGKCVPIYSAAALLGHGKESREAAWFVLCEAATLALAFDGFDGYLSVPKAEVRTVPARDSKREHADELIGSDMSARFVIDIGSVVKAIEKRVEAGKEKRHG